LKTVLKNKLIKFVLEFKSQVDFWKITLSPKIKPDLNTALQYNIKAYRKTQCFSKF